MSCTELNDAINRANLLRANVEDAHTVIDKQLQQITRLEQTLNQIADMDASGAQADEWISWAKRVARKAVS